MIAFLPGPQSGLAPMSNVGGVGPFVLGETVNPLSSASLSKTNAAPKFNLAPYPMLIE